MFSHSVTDRSSADMQRALALWGDDSEEFPHQGMYVQGVHNNVTDSFQSHAVKYYQPV